MPIIYDDCHQDQGSEENRTLRNLQVQFPDRMFTFRIHNASAMRFNFPSNLLLPAVTSNLTDDGLAADRRTNNLVVRQDDP